MRYRETHVEKPTGNRCSGLLVRLFAPRSRLRVSMYRGRYRGSKEEICLRSASPRPDHRSQWQRTKKLHSVSVVGSSRACGGMGAPQLRASGIYPSITHCTEDPLTTSGISEP